jgi:VanZ family protein
MQWCALVFGLLVLVTIIAADLGFLDFVHRIHDIPIADKAVHFGLYGMLNFLAILATHEWRPAWGLRGVAVGCTMTLVVVAGLEELSQIYIPARTFSIWDLAAGIAGVLVFAVLAAVAKRSGATRST